MLKIYPNALTSGHSFSFRFQSTGAVSVPFSYVVSSDQFRPRCYICAWKSPCALHPLRSFSQCTFFCFFFKCRCWTLTHVGPSSRFLSRLNKMNDLLATCLLKYTTSSRLILLLSRRWQCQIASIHSDSWQTCRCALWPNRKQKQKTTESTVKTGVTAT